MLSKNQQHTKGKFWVVITMLVMTAFIGGCSKNIEAEPTEDPQFLITRVAETVSAQIEQTAAAQSTPTQTATGTPTLTPTISPTPTVQDTKRGGMASNNAAPTTYQQPAITTVCDQAGFLADVTIPDGTVIEPGVTFTKTWQLSNDGSCTWTNDYSLVFYSGSQMSGEDSIQLTDSYVYQGGSVEISIDLIAPLDAGTYTGYWALQNADGDIFGIGTGGSPFYVQIVVSTSSTATPTATSTSDTTATATATTADTTPTATEEVIATTAVPATSTPVPATSTPEPTAVPTETPVPTTAIPTDTQEPDPTATPEA